MVRPRASIKAAGGVRRLMKPINYILGSSKEVTRKTNHVLRQHEMIARHSGSCSHQEPRPLPPPSICLHQNHQQHLGVLQIGFHSAAYDLDAHLTHYHAGLAFFFFFFSGRATLRLPSIVATAGAAILEENFRLCAANCTLQLSRGMMCLPR